MSMYVSVLIICPTIELALVTLQTCAAGLRSVVTQTPRSFSSLVMAGVVVFITKLHDQ